ncbi:MAG TPA: hypothetical protein VKX25_10475 [Bryobacteraceae bacterium]|jgi:hypothetical protein|nr:hypothetical protein [Bryobacteraceae bacterium]
MRVPITFALMLVAAGTLLGSKKVISPTTSASNEQVDIVATIVLDETEITQKLGADPGKGIALLEVRVTPKTDQPVQVSPDDFILLAHDDGERSKPFEPEQLAGNGAMVVTSKEDTVKRTGSTIGMGGIMMGGAGGGNASPGNPTPKTIHTKMDSKNQGNAGLLEALKAKQFPTTDAKDEVSGYLYFPLDGKHKLKNLAVLYRGPAGKLNLEFQH